MGHPSYTESIDDADVVLLDFDSLRQCLYPTYKVDCHQKLKPELPASMTWEVEDQGLDDEDALIHLEAQEHLGSAANGSEVLPDDVDVALRRGEDKADLETACGRPNGMGSRCSDIYTNEVVNMITKYGLGAKSQLIVFFINVNGGHFEAQVAQKVSASLHPRMVIAGLDLHASFKPFFKLNLLQPLMPQSKFRSLTDDKRRPCAKRELLATFVGKGSKLRAQLLRINHPRVKVVLNGAFFNTHNQTDSGMMDLLLKSTFGFSPRGDSHYSFRLAETLAAGAVPVILDDDYTFPYGLRDVKDWAVHLPESNVSRAAALLESFTPEKICAMQKKGREILSRAHDMKGTVTGFVEGLDRVRYESLVHKQRS